MSFSAEKEWFECFAVNAQDVGFQLFKWTGMKLESRKGRIDSKTHMIRAFKKKKNTVINKMILNNFENRH